MDDYTFYAKHILVWHDDGKGVNCMSFPLYFNKKNKAKGIYVPKDAVEATARLYFKDGEDLLIEFGLQGKSLTGGTYLKFCEEGEANCYVVRRANWK